MRSVSQVSGNQYLSTYVQYARMSATHYNIEYRSLLCGTHFMYVDTDVQTDIYFIVIIKSHYRPSSFCHRNNVHVHTKWLV